MAVALVTRINREFGSELPLQILFDRPTIEKLAHRLDGAAATPPPAWSGSTRPVRGRRSSAGRAWAATR
ncbi:acyl carrier protein [Streptomyces sp. SJL17-4]|uniref:acyl carrier protein n=1 Tax=Streptomyces sp. SJL17-4 TaxID=2967224 RepID=UPI0030CDDC19